MNTIDRPRSFYALSCGHSGTCSYEAREASGQKGFVIAALYSQSGKKLSEEQWFNHFGCSDCGKLSKVVSIQPVE